MIRVGVGWVKKGGGGNLTELIEKNLYISSFQTQMVKKAVTYVKASPKSVGSSW